MDDAEKARLIEYLDHLMSQWTGMLDQEGRQDHLRSALFIDGFTSAIEGVQNWVKRNP